MLGPRTISIGVALLRFAPVARTESECLKCYPSNEMEQIP
jgi:hypothetical protein